MKKIKKELKGEVLTCQNSETNPLFLQGNLASITCLKPANELNLIFQVKDLSSVFR